MEFREEFHVEVCEDVHGSLWMFMGFYLLSCFFQAILRGPVPLQLSNGDRQHSQQPEPPGASEPGETFDRVVVVREETSRVPMGNLYKNQQKSVRH